MTEYPSQMIGVHLMIATGQFVDMLERLEKRAQENRDSLKGACVNRPFEREQHRFYDGYESALRDMFRELEHEI